MEDLTHYPLLLFMAAFAALWLAGAVGSWLRTQNPDAGDEQTEDLGVILGATLTLLALIIGFSVSMASSRYDHRKSFEEAEANAIGTELLRVDLLPPADAANARRLLGAYLDQRILFFLNRDETRQVQIDQSISQLQANLWATVRGPASAQPTPIAALVLTGMNDVINSQGYTQAAFWNRIPRAAWWLMATIAGCSNVAKLQADKDDCSHVAICRLDRLPSDRRYRCTTAWFDPRQSSESRKFGEVTWALKFAS